jgi:3-oxoacyl-[acyl-carrier-protein] synthase II
MGVISPLGDTTEKFWESISAGIDGIGELTRFDTSMLSSKRGAEIPAQNDEARPHQDSPLAVHWAATVAEQATEDANLTRTDMDSQRVGVCFGTVMGTRSNVDDWLLDEKRSEDSAPARHAWTVPALLSREPARRLGFDGPNCVIATACAAGNSAIAYGAEALQHDRADAMVVGGVDEISQATLLVFNSFRALAPQWVQPFDAQRQGLMLGEGAAAMVLEREEDARARGAKIHGRVLGHSNVGDAHHMTAPHPQGRGAIRSMRQALTRAGLGPSDVDHVNAHGTGTPANDAVEALAIREVLGTRADHVPVTALKSMLGHAQGGASALEAVASLLTMRDNLIPPTAHYETPDPACNLDIVVGSARRGNIRTTLTNAFGFWGNIECVVLGTA